MAKGKKTNNKHRFTLHRTKNRETWTPLKTGG